MEFNKDFYRGRRVFITGHTGFKGSWMCKVLNELGANVTGYALDTPTNPSLFNIINLDKSINSIIGDVRDLDNLTRCIKDARPEIVIHMAAQPIVRESYVNPVYTYEVNVMGTVNILQAIRSCDSVKSFINVTTDKVYLNKEWEWGYRENDELNGFDPYSNSKSCSELVTASFKKSFFDADERSIAISTCRAGNVIGGGDFAVDRIIPDCVRAIQNIQIIKVRNPFSVRPYEHVLEPVIAYLLLAQKQYEDVTLAGNYNIGPNDSDCYSTGQLVSLFCDKWNNKIKEFDGLNSVEWKDEYDGGPHEANYLKLDCSRIKRTIGWKPIWNLETSIEKIIEWTITYLKDGSIDELMTKQINEFLDSIS